MNVTFLLLSGYVKVTHTLACALPKHNLLVYLPLQVTSQAASHAPHMEHSRCSSLRPVKVARHQSGFSGGYGFGSQTIRAGFALRIIGTILFGNGFPRLLMSIPCLVRCRGHWAIKPQVRRRVPGAFLVGAVGILEISHGRFEFRRHKLARRGAVSIPRNHRTLHRSSEAFAKLSKLRASHLSHVGNLSLDWQITREGNQPS